ncbi:MAG: peptidase S13, partial [Desulfobacteraceae bacterium]|nr:peptidase S13 [Desulfobacteraceae bacterium]
NFIANQIFLSMGATRYGPPATVEKSQTAIADFFGYLGLSPMSVEEGSGLSRRNRISAAQMIKVLDYFRPYRHLLPHEGRAWSKTGTLNDVKSVAGYIVPEHANALSFVIILNGRHLGYRTRERIFHLIEKNVLKGYQAKSVSEN